MSDIKIKSEFAKKRVAFGGTLVPSKTNKGKSAVPFVGDLSQEDLKKLAIIALESKNKSLLVLFDGELPTIEELKKDEVKKEVKAIAAKPADSKPIV